MKPRFLLHAFLIIISSFIPYLWSQNTLTSPYTLQLCGALVILYTGFKKLLPHTNHNLDPNILIILTANSITQLLIFSTGGAQSPLFFLYYFLIFAFAMIYESFQAFTISLVTVLIYLIQTNLKLDSATIAHLFSLLLITPLAQIFSNTQLKNLEAEGKIAMLESDIKKEETDSLLWLSTEAKPTMNTVINSVSDLIIYLNSSRHQLQIPKSFVDKMKAIQTDLLVLFSSSEDLEDSIKELTDSKKI